MGMLVMALVVAAAQTTPQQVQVGDWIVGESVISTYMASSNDSGGVFGKFCAGDSCTWMIAGSTVCVAGVDSPVVINAESGAIWSMAHCLGPIATDPNYYQSTLTDPDSIDKLVASNTQIGVAMPLGGTAFKVFRFDVKNGSSAFTALIGRFQARRSREANSTRDTQL